MSAALAAVAMACGGPAAPSQNPAPIPTLAPSSSETAEPAPSGLRVTVVAGSGTAGYGGDGGPATAAQLNYPTDMAFDSAGNLYFADTKNNVVRRVAVNGVITTVAGTRAAGFAGDGGPANEAFLNQPSDVVFGPDGAMYLVDQNNGRVRRVDPDGTITTIAGDGRAHSAGDGGPALAATLEAPSDIAFDGEGNLYLSESTRIRRIALDGTISTFAGGGDGTGDAGPATEAELGGPSGIEFGPDGELYIADFISCRVRAVATDGTIRNVSGPGKFRPGLACESLGDGGQAPAAAINRPPDLAVASDGTLYVLEHFGPNVLRKIDPTGEITTVAIDHEVAEPLSILLVDDTTLFLADRDHEQILLIDLMELAN